MVCRWGNRGKTEPTSNLKLFSPCHRLLPLPATRVCGSKKTYSSQHKSKRPFSPPYKAQKKGGPTHREGRGKPSPLVLETTVKSSLTWNNRWLKLVACQLTPPHRINVWRLAVHPLVILVVPAIKMDAKETVDHTLHCGYADKPRLHQVHCFHLHACLEAMVWVVLVAENMKKENSGTQSKPTFDHQHPRTSSSPT